MRGQADQYKVLNVKYRPNGIWWERTTTYERNKRIGQAITLALNEKDESVAREKPDVEKCALCRAGEHRHTVELHDEMVEAWYQSQETEGHVKQVTYVDAEDAMEWEILNAEAENRPINWSVANAEQQAEMKKDSEVFLAIAANDWEKVKKLTGNAKGFTQQQVDAMWR